MTQPECPRCHIPITPGVICPNCEDLAEDIPANLSVVPDPPVRYLPEEFGDYVSLQATHKATGATTQVALSRRGFNAAFKERSVHHPKQHELLGKIRPEFAKLGSFTGDVRGIAWFDLTFTRPVRASRPRKAA